MTATAEPLMIEPIGVSLTEQQARDIFRQGEEAVVFALLQQARMLAQAHETSVEARRSAR